MMIRGKLLFVFMLLPGWLLAMHVTDDSPKGRSQATWFEWAVSPAVHAYTATREAATPDAALEEEIYSGFFQRKTFVEQNELFASAMENLIDVKMRGDIASLEKHALRLEAMLTCADSSFARRYAHANPDHALRKLESICELHTKMSKMVLLLERAHAKIAEIAPAVEPITK